MKRRYNKSMDTRNIDARKLSSSEQVKKRRNVIKLREEGVKNKEVARILGLPEQTISTIYNRYKREGGNSLLLKKRGRSKGDAKILSEKQELQIIYLLINKDPREIQSNLSLWTRESVRELIQNELGIDIPESTMRDYLNKWHLTFKSISRSKRDYLEDSLMHDWLTYDYKVAQSVAKKDKRSICWIANTARIPVSSILNNLKPEENSSVYIQMIYISIGNEKTMFFLYTDGISSENLINFMQRVIDSSMKKIYMILNNSTIYQSKRLKTWVKDQGDRIKYRYLPPNPKSSLIKKRKKEYSSPL